MEAARAVERAWQRRRQELARWHPTSAWLVLRPAFRTAGRGIEK